MSKRIRQYLGILGAIAAYYAVHEGAHYAVARYFGVFRQINILGLGLQIDVYAERMTETQLGIFCLAGAVAACAAGWLLILSAGSICKAGSSLFRAAMWYVTLALLMVDPIYLSLLCGFFGGGDMNGISLLFPETAARLVFGGIGVIHIAVIVKYLLPVYKASFRDH